MPDARALAAASGTVVLWGTAFTGIAIALESFSPGELAFLRFGVACALLLMVRGSLLRPVPPAADLARLAAVGLIGITGYHLLLNWGQTRVAPSTTSLIIETAPAFTAFIAQSLGHERVSVRAWAGILLSLAGCAVIAVEGGGGLAFDPYVLVLLGAAILTALYFVIQRPLVLRYGAQRTTLWTMIFGTVPFLLWSPAAVAAIPDASIESVGAAVFIGIFPAALAYTLWTFAIGRLGASRVSTFIYLIPVVAVATEWLWYGTLPTVGTLIGGGLALVGVVVAQSASRAPPSSQDRAPSSGT